MDFLDLLKMSGMSAGSIAIVILIYKVLKTAHGKKFVSQCCGKKVDVGFQIKSMESPPTPISNPMHKKISVVVDGEKSNARIASGYDRRRNSECKDEGEICGGTGKEEGTTTESKNDLGTS